MEGEELCVINENNLLFCERDDNEGKLKVKLTDDRYFSITYSSIFRVIGELEAWCRSMEAQLK
jgi:hypothetical protein